jgi:hypothetical protein
MIGFFIVQGFGSQTDGQGFETTIDVAVKYDMNIKGTLYLPPHLRKSQCEIGVGSEVFGVMDDVSGLGCAMYGVDCDINFKNKYDYEFTKTLTVDKATTLKDTLDVTKAVTAKDTLNVTKDITSVTGDVIATTISLKTHTHPATLTASVTGTATPAGLVEASGPATGSTGTPT